MGSSKSFVLTFFVSLCVASSALGGALSRSDNATFADDTASHVLDRRQVLNMGDSKDIWCDRIAFVDKTIKCPAGAKLYYGSAQKPRVTAKTTTAAAKVQISATGRAAGVTAACTEILSGNFVLSTLLNSDACLAAEKKTSGGSTMTKVKALLNSANNRNYIQKQRLLALKNQLAQQTSPNVLTLKRSLIDSLVVIDYFESTLAASTNVAKQVDSLVSSGTGVNPGISAAWSKKVATFRPIKTALLAELQKEINQKVKQAQASQTRQAQCGAKGPAAGPGKTKTTPRLARRSLLAGFSPLPASSLAARAFQKAPLDGTRAPPGPQCPAKGAPQKKTVKRSAVKTKPSAVKNPRQPAKRPVTKKANPAKRVAKRPATRSRRPAGKPAPRKRTTPKKKPRVVPKPPKKPKGKARPRRRR